MSHNRNKIPPPQQQYRSQGNRPWMNRDRGPQGYPGEHSGQTMNRSMENAQGSRYEGEAPQYFGSPEFEDQENYSRWQQDYRTRESSSGLTPGYRQMHYPQREEDSDYSWGGEYIEADAEFRPGQRAREERRMNNPGEYPRDTSRPSYAGRGPQGYRRSDDRITEDINEHLTRDHWVDATRISVETRNGEVTLEGTVTDRESKRRAEGIAESCSGVKDVQNQLRIKREDSAESASEPQRDKSEEKRSKPS